MTVPLGCMHASACNYAWRLAPPAMHACNGADGPGNNPTRWHAHLHGTSRHALAMHFMHGALRACDHILDWGDVACMAPVLAPMHGA